MTNSSRRIKRNIGCVFLLAWLPQVADASTASLRAECKKIAHSTGLFSPLIEQACSGYAEYQPQCKNHIYRRGVPTLIRGDNYMVCLCQESKKALDSSAQDLCHASAAIHGLLDPELLLIQEAARQADLRRNLKLKADESAEEAKQSSLRTEKELKKKVAERDSVKVTTEQILARNTKILSNARIEFQATEAKLRAAEAAARNKLMEIEKKMASESKRAQNELSQSENEVVQLEKTVKKSIRALQKKESEQTRAARSEREAVEAEQRAVERHLRGMGAERQPQAVATVQPQDSSAQSNDPSKGKK